MLRVNNVSNIFLYTLPMTVPLKNTGPKTPLQVSPHQIVTFCLLSCYSTVSRGLSCEKYTQLCWLVAPLNLKQASSDHFYQDSIFFSLCSINSISQNWSLSHPPTNYLQFTSFGLYNLKLRQRCIPCKDLIEIF